jgi:S-adenosylmethionine decarboxylase
MTEVLESAQTVVGAFAGRHAIAELEGVAAALLDDEQLLRKVLSTALTEAGATILDMTSKQFVPQGVTVLALLSESHASIHTYPEVGSAFMDVFTCGHRADPDHVVQLVAKALHTPIVHKKTINRGHAVL